MTNLYLTSLPVDDAGLTSPVDDEMRLTSTAGIDLKIQTVIDHAGGQIASRFLILQDGSGYVLLNSDGRIILL